MSECNNLEYEKFYCVKTKHDLGMKLVKAAIFSETNTTGEWGDSLEDSFQIMAPVTVSECTAPSECTRKFHKIH